MCNRQDSLNHRIDHTLLSPWTTEDHIQVLCEQAIEHDFRGVCVFPKHVKKAKELLSKGMVSAVVDFPLGASPLKRVEAEYAVDRGADELDVVWDLSWYKSGHFLKLVQQLTKIVSLNKPVKVIVETCFLEQFDIEQAFQIVHDSGAWCIKTSTGNFPDEFYRKARAVSTWKRLNETTGFDLKIKASGGIENKSQVECLIAAGADIIGTSKGVHIVTSVNKQF